MFEDLLYDDCYVPDKEVLDSAFNLSGTAYDMGNCVDRLLCSDVISIKRVTNYKGFNPEGDIVLLISYEGWSIHKPYWEDPTDPEHSIDSIWNYRCTALFLRSVLIKNEIDDQHGISAWEDIDLDICSIKTTEAPTQVLDAYCDEIDHDWYEFVDQWLDCGEPDYSFVEPKVKNALDKAIAKYKK